MDRRSGSALLIVLGFLSFMVVSAVAFSIYMRSERLPSSVFRRKAVSRQLVHAAVARAIGDLDNALRADPYPGVHSGSSSQMRNAGGRFFDEWHGRVFMPPNPGITACSVHNSPNQVSVLGRYGQDNCIMAPKDETVAVLNLEALGYVPAPLFNDVRFLSRLTWSAKWRPFDQGAGRYAYVAVNVSDYLDVNRLKDVADCFRSSGSRINLAPMLSGGSYDSSAVSRAKAFRDHVRNNGVNSRNGNRHASSDWPFVSLLDFYLDMQRGYADCQSPFYWWIGEGKSGSGYDYSGGDIDKVRTQCFVTDSWFPPSPAEVVAGPAVIDLNKCSSSDADFGQPFPEEYVRKDNRKSLKDCAMLNTPFFQRVANGSLPSGSSVGGGQNRSLTYVDAALLKDYLDRDDTPTSLALPCVERVPMVAAMGISAFNVDISLNGTPGAPSAPVPASGGGTKTTVLTEYKLSQTAFRNNNTLTAAIVFPFKRAKEINQTFTARALMRVFLVDENASGLRISGSPLENMRPSDDADWNEGSPPASFTLRGLNSPVPPFMFTLVSRPVTINTAKDIDTQGDVAIGNDSGHSVIFRFDAPNGYDSQVVFTKKVDTITPAATPAAPTPAGVPQPPEYCINVSPFAADGTLVEKNADHWMNETDFIASFGARKFTLQAAAWIMIENGNGDVVDLVPAIAQDDGLYNGVSIDFVRLQGYDGTGSGTPVFRFRGPSQAAFDVTAASPLSLPPGAWTPASYCAVDPRFNYAPEDWLPRDASVTGEGWVDWITGHTPDNGTGNLLADGGRDSDVFMFVSNQGVLQSMGELAFIPRITAFGNQSVQGASAFNNLLEQANGRMDGAERSSSDDWSAIAHADIAWRTYRPYESSGATSDYLMNFRNFYSYGGTQLDTKAFRDFGDRGVRVNPYTDSDSVFMSAFAYTPYDWWAAAGTNTCGASGLDDSSNPKDTASQRLSRFGKLDPSEYVFSGSSPNAKLSDEELAYISAKIRTAMRTDPAGNWQSGYDGLDWYGDGEVDPEDDDSFKKFLDVDLEKPLHGVDRKFLYSYWRGCFANRQQLFLVFVRAESGALGSGGEGKVPPQQGGRGVALVWRDPETPIYPGKSTDEARRIDREEYVEYDTGADTNPSFRKPHRTRMLFFHQFD